MIGSDNVAAAIHTHHSHTKVSDPVTAVIAAYQHLGVHRIGLVTLYIPDVSSALQELLASHGIEIAAIGSFERKEETIVARIDTSSVKRAICRVGKAEGVQAVFASCTNLRCFSVIEPCETILNKLVFNSNLALAWHILSLAGFALKGRGPGSLFQAARASACNP